MATRYKSPPNWTRDELILALDLYFALGFVNTNSRYNSRSREIEELSNLLNTLPIHNDQDRGTNFRNAAGVFMKLSNFLRLDPRYSGKGLERGARLDEIVWDEFEGDRQRLHHTAQAIRNGIAVVVGESRDPQIEDEFPEGRVLSRLHQIRERNSKAVKVKKAVVLKLTGKLACEVCGFDFEESYGALGHSFAECHHTVPLASLQPHTKTKLIDLSILCANCHRMAHRSPTWLSIDDLKLIIQKAQK